MPNKLIFSVIAVCAICEALAFAGCNPTEQMMSSLDAGSEVDAADAGAGSYTAPCDHPGSAGDAGDGRCHCPQVIDTTGSWVGTYDCKAIAENTCHDRDAGESFTFTQTGNVVHAESPEGTFVMDGTICGKFFVWSGGERGQYAECGTTQFTDQDHYLKDSCYKNLVDAGGGDAGPSCLPTFATNCPDQTGICTNVGARDSSKLGRIANPLCANCNPICP